MSNLTKKKYSPNNPNHKHILIFLLCFIVLSSMEFVHSGHQYWFCIRAEFKVVLDKSGWVQDEHKSWNH